MPIFCEQVLVRIFIFSCIHGRYSAAHTHTAPPPAPRPGHPPRDPALQPLLDPGHPRSPIGGRIRDRVVGPGRPPALLVRGGGCVRAGRKDKLDFSRHFSRLVFLDSPSDVPEVRVFSVSLTCRKNTLCKNKLDFRNKKWQDWHIRRHHTTS